jgi:MFS family permease
VPPLRGLPAEVRALVGVAFMVAVGFGVVAPAIPLFAREFGVGTAAASAVVSAFAFMRLVTAPFAGRLVNTLGERTMLATGIVVVAASSVLAGLAQTYWQLLVLRGVGGIGSVMFSVSAASILIQVTPNHLRGRAQGAWAGSFLVGLIAGPALGTVAAWSLRAPFFVYAGTLAVAGALALVRLRHSEFANRTSATPRRTDRAPMTLRVALRNRAYLGALVATFAGAWTVVGARSAIVPQYVTDGLGLSTEWVYVAFVVVGLNSGAMLWPFGRIADSRGRRQVILLGLAVGTIGFCALPALPSLAGLLISMALIAVAGAADSVAPGAVLGDVVAGRGGTVVAFFQMSRDSGTVLGPVVAGWLVDWHGYALTFLVSAGIMLAAVPAVLRAPETLRTPSPDIRPATDRPRGRRARLG